MSSGITKASIFPRWILALFAMGFLALVLMALKDVLAPIFFAFLIAYLLDPVVDRFESVGLPRAAGIVILLTIVLGALSIFVFFALPGIVRDVASFVRELPGEAERLYRASEPWLVAHGVPVPHTIDEALDQMQLDTGQLAEKVVAPASVIVGRLVGGTASALSAAFGLLMVPIFAFYLLYDFDRMTRAAGELVPYRIRPLVFELAREIDQVLGQFVRGQFAVMFILGVLYSTAYGFLGVRLAIPIGIVAGLLSFIPYVGGAVALGLALLMTFLDFTGFGQVLWVVLAYTVIQVLEGFVITPLVVGDKVGLSSVWVLLALMIGGELFGFAGVLLAVPAAAVLKILLARAVNYYRRSPLFETGAPEVERVLRESLPPRSAEPRFTNDSAENPVIPATSTAVESPGPVDSPVDEVAPTSETEPSPGRVTPSTPPPPAGQTAEGSHRPAFREIGDKEDADGSEPEEDERS